MSSRNAAVPNSTETKIRDKAVKSTNAKTSTGQKNQAKLSTEQNRLDSILNPSGKGSADKLEDYSERLTKDFLYWVKEDKVSYVKEIMEASSAIDDCIRWHLLMESVQSYPYKDKDTGMTQATTDLCKAIIERCPYLAFENPSETDDMKKVFQRHCCDKAKHDKRSRSKNTPFHEAARRGYADVVASMIHQGSEYQKPAPVDKLAARPRFSDSGWTFLDILQRTYEYDTALTLAGRARQGSAKTVRELLKVQNIAWLPSNRGVQRSDPVVEEAIRMGKSDIVEALVNAQPDLVGAKVIGSAIEYLNDPIDLDSISPSDRSIRSSVFKSLVRRAKQGTLTIDTIDSVIRSGFVADFEAIPPESIEKEARSCLLHLAVKYQNLEFVTYFVESFPDSVIEEAEIPGTKEGPKYPLWHQNNLDKGVLQEERIRDIIVTNMIHRVTDIELLSDIFYKSGEELRDICFDMSHLSSANYPVSDIVTSIIGSKGSQAHLNYEKTLRYAEFPQLDLMVEERDSFRASYHLQKEHDEVFRVLGWLKEKGVAFIIKLKVPDRMINPHDETRMATWIRDFQVKELDWKVLDLSITSLEEETKKRLEKLHLYSSGNRAVISHWFSKEGLHSLPKLNYVEISIIKETCTYGHCLSMKAEIESQLGDFKKLKGVQGTSGVTTWYATPKLTDLSALAVRVSPKLAGFLKSLPAVVRRRGGAFKPTKVAILDNGILSIPHVSRDVPMGSAFTHGASGATDERKSLWGRIKDGRSFVHEDSKHSHWYFASDAHGTQLANLICAIDPLCEIYIARVAEGRSGITAKRVAKAIEWAIDKEVDIISMSFIVRESSKDLEIQIGNATDKGIVMTCSTHDEGSRIAKAYPAMFKNPERSLLVLAACDRYGAILRETNDESYHYLIPGHDVAAGVIPFLKSEDTISGSSVATAIASGICSLSLTCDRLNDPDPNKRYEEGVGKGSRYAFVDMCLSRMQAPRSKFVLLEKFGGINDLGQKGVDAVTVLRQSFFKE